MIDNSTKNTWKELADLYLDQSWEQWSKNDLVNKCIEAKINEQEDLYNAYFASVLYKYFPKINNLYKKSLPAATVEDCYEWLIHAIMWAIDNRPWQNPDKPIYGDPNGPDKVINRSCACQRLTFFQQLYRYNKQANIGNLSLDSLVQDNGDFFEPIDDDSDLDDVIVDNRTKELIQNYFDSNDEIYAFVVDGILSCDCFDDEGVFVMNKLCSHLHNMTEEYCQDFGYRYDIDVDRVTKSAQYLNRQTKSVLKDRISDCFLNLQTTFFKGRILH